MNPLFIACAVILGDVYLKNNYVKKPKKKVVEKPLSKKEIKENDFMITCAGIYGVLVVIIFITMLIGVTLKG